MKLVITNRHTTSPFWTPERDARLQTLEREGFPPEKIAARFGVTRSSVMRRSYYLRGLVFRAEALRANPRLFRKERKRIDSEALVAMRYAMRKGVPRNKAIARARKAGASLQSLCDELGVTRQTIWRAVVEQGMSTSLARNPFRAKAALAAMRTAISKGVARNRAMVQAYEAGATLQAIADEFQLSRQRAHQIMLWEKALHRASSL